MFLIEQTSMKYRPEKYYISLHCLHDFLLQVANIKVKLACHGLRRQTKMKRNLQFRRKRPNL